MFKLDSEKILEVYSRLLEFIKAQQIDIKAEVEEFANEHGLEEGEFKAVLSYAYENADYGLTDDDQKFLKVIRDYVEEVEDEGKIESEPKEENSDNILSDLLAGANPDGVPQN